MAGAFVVGSYFTLSQVLIPMIRALTETTTEMPVDLAFNRGVADILAGYDDGGGATYVLASEVTLNKTDDWWDVEFTKKKQLTLRNLSTAPLASESATTQQITVNTKELYDAGSLQANCQDLRVVFVATESANMRTELPRSFYPATGATDCSDSTATTVAFPLQEALWGSGGIDSNYELYYGNGGASQPTFRGGSALQFDGGDTVSFGTLGPSINPSNLTIEAWVKFDESIPVNTIWVIAQHHSSGAGKGFELLLRRYSGTSNYLQFNLWNGVAGVGYIVSKTDGITWGKWQHIVGVYDSLSHSQLLFLDGILVASGTLDNYVAATNYGYDIGYSSYGGYGYIKASIDSVRYSSVARYLANFTPSKTEFAPDENTLVLTNFNEGSGSTVVDGSGHKNGSLGSTTAAPTWVDSASGYEIESATSSVNATLVCPFNGTTTCVGGETPTTATGAIRYSGGSALQFDGISDGVQVSDSSSLDVASDQLTVEAWINYTSSSSVRMIVSKSDTYRIMLIDGQLRFDLRLDTWARSVSSSDIPGANTWFHIAGVYDGSTQYLFVNGVLKSSTSRSGNIVPNNASLGVGKEYGFFDYFYSGLIDEARVSNIPRYISNFTPQTTPFEPDENTKLLLHFDENGDDPRNTGKAIDSSGNGNHGTITGAKYVSGLVGVDPSTGSGSALTGALPASTYASHQGVFIEEGTTNKITNPSFEHSTYNTNWAQPVTFSLEDQFTTDRTAGAVNGSSAEPLGGTRTAINTSSKITISSGKLNFATGATVNDGVWYPAQARANGKVLVGSITPSNTNGDVVFGWDSNQTGLINDAVKFAAAGVLQVIPNGGTAITVGSYTATTYQVAGVLRSAGVYWFIKGGTYTQWTLLYATTAGTGDGYPAIQAGSTTSIFTADNIRIPTTTWLPTPLVYDSFSRADGALGSTENLNPDGISTPQATWTGGTWNIGNGFAINQPSEGTELLSNPSFETGDPPTSWYNQGTPTTHERSSNYAHSGSYSLHLITDAVNEVEKQVPTVSNGVWYVSSGYMYKVASGDYQNLGLPSFNYTGIGVGSWQKLTTVGIGTVGNQFVAGPTYASEIYYDDVSLKALSLQELMASVVTNKADVVAEIEPKFESMSRNHTFAGMVLRMDNADTPNNFILATISGDGANRWGRFTLTKYVSGTYSQLFTTDLQVVGSQYIQGRKLKVVLNGSSVKAYYDDKFLGEATVTDTGILNNTLHGAFSTYSGDAVDNFQLWPVGKQGEFNALPVGLSVSENNSAPYYKFGSKSVLLENSGGSGFNYTTTATASANAAYTLSAYVYNGTSGAVGGTVDSTVATLASGSASLASTYTDMGGGWWRLSYSSGTQPAGEYVQGVAIQPGKTVYVDGVQLEAKTYATTYADGSLGSGYSWSGVANESSSTKTIADLRYPVTSNISTSQGSFSFWLKPTWSSSDGDWKYFFATGTDLGCGYLRLHASGTNIQVWDGCSNGVARSVTYTANSWIHIVVVWGPSNLNLFVNGTGGTGSSTFTSRAINYIHIGNAGNASQLGQRGATTSDFRIYSNALTAQEATQLYHSGLQTHTSSAEAVDRYPASGTYTSPVIDLGANGAWGNVPWSIGNALNGGGINYFTRTSMDNSVWSEWQAVTGSVGEGSWTGGIASDPRRYFQWKANLTSSSDQSQSPSITAMSTTYVEDSSPPANPAQVALGYTSHASSSATLTSNSWYNYSTPKFTWEPGVDDPAEGQSSSGIDGYHVLLTTDQSATPSANLASPCYRFSESDDRVFSVGTAPGTCTLTDADYYLRMQTKDNSGNVSDPVTLFTYRYDGTAPRSPVSVSSTTVGYTSQNEFSFYWPPASDQGLNQSGLAYYEYKTGATEGAFSTWTKSNEPGEELVTLTSNITAYQEGQNFFFVRTVDFAGNVSAEISNLGVSPFYYNESAPTAPVNVVISPVTSSDSQAAENIFTVIWDKPASYSGELAKYYYCVNCTPSVETMSQTTSVQTADRTLTNIALATQQGKNTFYLVAEDNNINTDTGRGNVNFEAYATAEFYASTIAPGSPTNLTISDASDRDAEVWRLTLAWKQAVTGGTPAHYNIYRSTDGENFTKIGETTSTAYTDADLTQSQIYYYKVYAIDNANSTSLASNTVTLAPEGKYTTPPLAGGSPNVTAGSTVATITWSTGRVAYGAVEYGKSTDYEQSVAETVAVGNHSIRLTGLTPGTTYHYRVQALDDSVLMGYDRENAYSADYTFTTSALPTISNVEVSDLTLASVIINWSAVSLASAQIEYGESTAYGASVSVGVGSEGTYSTKLSALTDSTTYHFRIRAVDIDGTDITSDDYTFTTLTFPKVTAVVFKTDQAQNGTAISLAWSTNVPTTSELEYQPVEVDPKYKATAESNYDNSSVLRSLTPVQLNQLPVVPVGAVEHSDRASYESRHLSRITSLSDGSLYIFTIRGRDQYGNEFVSEPIRYVTGADTKPPTVSDLVIETPIVGEGVESKAEIVISFTTDEPALSQIVWGPGTGSEYPEATQTSKDLTTEHIIILRDLKPTSSYHLKIKTTDESGNQSETEDTIVVTPTAQQAAFELIIKNLEGVFGFLGIN